MTYAEKNYHVPAQVGRRVIVYGKPGIIAEDRGHYIGVNFDEYRPGQITNAHPVDGVEYLEMGEIRKPTRSQARYQRYLRADAGYTFREWLELDGRTP